MVKSDSIAAFDIVLFGFMIVPILFLGLTDEIVMMLCVMAALVAIRLLIQLPLRKRIEPARTVSPFFRFDPWSYNAIFLSIGGSAAIVFGFEGGIIITGVIAIPVLVAWYAIYHYLFRKKQKKYDPYTEKIDYLDDKNDVD